ncbi:MAG: antitoxin VapB family protein [Candidatus Njordarchaeales archaeon]
MNVSTITISSRIKKRLMKLKGNKSWDEFFEEIIEQLEIQKLVEEAKKFQEEFQLSDDEAKKMLKFLRKSRHEWRFRYP